MFTHPNAHGSTRSSNGKDLDAGVSAALFAPAWVWEECGAESREEAWLAREHTLWSSLAAAWEEPRPVCTQLPLFTNFDRGAGRALHYQV